VFSPTASFQALKKMATKSHTVAETRRIRRENLRALIERMGDGAKQEIAAMLGHANASVISHWAGPKPTRNIAEQAARSIEQGLGLPVGWLDIEHAPSEITSAVIEWQHGKPACSTAPPPQSLGVLDVDVDMMAQAISAIEAAAQEAQMTLQPADKAQLTALVYQDLHRSGTPDIPRIRGYLRLVKR
jgi:hypothetical protein